MMPGMPMVALTAGAAEETAPLLDLPAELDQPNPFLRAAQPLLECVPLFKRAARIGDIGQLRDSLIAMVSKFTLAVSQAGVADESVAMARYCLCTLLDETIASTAWGGDVWGRQSLLVTFYHETSGGERFFRILQWLSQAPEDHLDALEFMHVLLSLGMEGRYRLLEGGRGELQRLRERLYLLLRAKRGPADPSLSLHWQAAARPNALRFNPRRIVLYVVLGLGAALVSLYLGLDYQLERSARQTLAAFEKIEPPVLVASAPSLPAARVETSSLAQWLAQEIRQGQVSVDRLPDRTVLTLHVDMLFKSGSAVLEPASRPLLKKIGQALGAVPGKIVVSGHSDNQATRTGAPNNWQLSKLRADAVIALLAANSGHPERYLSQGYGEDMPLVSNETPAGRAQNRRVVIAVMTAKGS